MSIHRTDFGDHATVLRARIETTRNDSPGRGKETERLALEIWMDEALARVEGDDGFVISYGHDHVEALWGDDTGAAVSTAIALQQNALKHREIGRGPLHLRIGVARGGAELGVWNPKPASPTGAVGGLFGLAAQRAGALASIATRGALLIDTGVLEDLSLRYLASAVGRERGWKGSDYLAPVREARMAATATPLVFYELKWSGQELMDDNDQTGVAQSATRTIGSLNRWNGATNATISADDGEIFSTSVKHIIGNSKIEPGHRVSFIPHPASEPGRSRRAFAVLAFGAEVSGEVVKVFSDRSYGFIRVTDTHGYEQDVFFHADDNQWPLEVGDRVRFLVGENVRGAAAKSARRDHDGAAAANVP